jgi:DHA1 family tetracycline resistance protein-like MFS transporter
MKKNKSLITIFLIVFIDLFGFSLILPLLPFIAERYSASPLQVGLLTSAYSFFQFIAAPILGRLSDRYGRKKILILSQLGSMAGFILLGVARSLPILFLSRIIDGTTGGNISVAQAYIADVTDKKNRARGMGLIGAAFGMGFILGPAIGGLLSRVSFSLPAYFAAGVSLITSISTWLFLKETVKTNRIIKKKNGLSLKKFQEIMTTPTLGFLIIVFFMQNFSFAGMQSNFALWTERTFSYGPAENGGLFALIGVVAVITQLILLPKLVKKFGERRILAIGALGLSLGLFGIFFGQYGIPVVYTALIFISISNGLTGPTLQAIASESVEKDEYGGTLGILQSSGSMARIFGPIAAGYMFETYNKNMPFISSGIIMMVVFLLILKFLPREGTVFSKLAKVFGK